MKKVFDIFLYNGERELLEIRLNVLNEVVDFFVPIELPHTFTGHPRSFCLDLRATYLEPFKNKILNLQGPNLYNNFLWANEWFARNLGGVVVLEKSKMDDIILLSDLDEIPNPQTIKENLDKIDTPVVFNQIYHFYKFNLECYTHGAWPGTIVTRSKHIQYDSLQIKDWFTKDFGLQKLRENRGVYPRIENGGNHYSYCFSNEEIQRKLRSFCHAPELNKPNFNNEKHIQNCIEKGESIWVESDGNRMKKIDLNETNTPKYILDNLGKYKHLLL